MTQQCYLGIDLGAESGRVVAGLFDGQRVQLEELHRFPNGAVNQARDDSATFGPQVDPQITFLRDRKSVG